jgi:hypothetical protein
MWGPEETDQWIEQYRATGERKDLLIRVSIYVGATLLLGTAGVVGHYFFARMVCGVWF